MTLSGAHYAAASLAKAGQALHGDQFVNATAADLGVSYRTMRRWLVNGEVPAGVWDDLAELIANQQRRLSGALWQINHDMRHATVINDDDQPF